MEEITIQDQIELLGQLQAASLNLLEQFITNVLAHHYYQAEPFARALDDQIALFEQSEAPGERAGICHLSVLNRVRDIVRDGLSERSASGEFLPHGRCLFEALYRRHSITWPLLQNVCLAPIASPPSDPSPEGSRTAFRLIPGGLSSSENSPSGNTTT